MGTMPREEKGVRETDFNSTDTVALREKNNRYRHRWRTERLARAMRFVTVVKETPSESETVDARKDLQGWRGERHGKRRHRPGIKANVGTRGIGDGNGL